MRVQKFDGARVLINTSELKITINEDVLLWWPLILCTCVVAMIYTCWDSMIYTYWDISQCLYREATFAQTASYVGSLFAFYIGVATCMLQLYIQ